MPTKEATIKDGWQKLKLGEVCDFNVSSIGKNYFYQEIEYIDISSVGTGVLNETTKYNINEAPGRAKRLVKKEDVIISNVRPNRRSFVYIKNPKENQVASTGFTVISTKKDIVNSRFIYYLVSAQSFTDYLTKNAKGSAYPAVDTSTFKDADILIPKSLDTQKKISDVLGAYDDLIEVNQKKIKILEDMAQTIYKEWFVKPVKDSLPEGWEVKKVEDLIKRIPVGKKYDNKTVETTGKVPVLDQGRSGFIGYHNDEPGVNATPENPIIVFANHTCYQNLIMFPFSAIQNVLPFISIDKHDILWLYYTTKDSVSFNDYKGHWPEFVAKKVSVPPVSLSQKFGELIKPMLIQKFTFEKQNKNLHKTRDLLIPKLISGCLEFK